MNRLATNELPRIERLVQRMLTRATDDLPVIGSGEMSVVVGWPPDDPTVVLKRLPPCGRSSARRHATLIEEYESLLGERGVRVTRSQMHTVDTLGGLVALYVVQPRHASESMLSSMLARAVNLDGHLERAVACVLDAVDVVDAQVGLDAQLSNWTTHEDGGVELIDTTTPFLRRAGVPELDLDLLFSTYVPVLRPVLKRFVAPSVLTRYHDRRQVALDLLGNLHRERLQRWESPVSELIGTRFGPAISSNEVAAYYASDRRTWALVHAAKRLERWRRHTFTSSVYPVLLEDRS